MFETKPTTESRRHGVGKAGEPELDAFRFLCASVVGLLLLFPCERKIRYPAGAGSGANGGKSVGGTCGATAAGTG